MSEQISGNFHETLGANGLMSVLHEAQDTVRSYDTKAQIVGVGYIFALGVVQQSGKHMPVPMEWAGWYVFTGWVVVILPIIMYALVLYPSRIDKVTKKRNLQAVDGTMYFDNTKFTEAEAYTRAVLKADWAKEIVFEIVKVSDIRDKKRTRFLRALYWTGASFFLLFLSQMLRANGVLQ
ncbi:MAG: hypothetical protein JJ900_06650 [Rhodospirillales bacterium]|nr:hypothetical protein [Rhodospirillales bacterium]MBO6786516.1 hypothetical protein [Rhodospirillales bacterium]